MTLRNLFSYYIFADVQKYFLTCVFIHLMMISLFNIPLLTKAEFAASCTVFILLMMRVYNSCKQGCVYGIRD